MRDPRSGALLLVGLRFDRVDGSARNIEAVYVDANGDELGLAWPADAADLSFTVTDRNGELECTYEDAGDVTCEGL